MLATQQKPDISCRSPLDAIRTLIAGTEHGNSSGPAADDSAFDAETFPAQLLAQLRWHRVGLRLQREIPTSLFTAQQQQQYARDCQSALARTAANIQSLRRIADCLDEHGIRYLSLKGPALSQLLYGNVLLKESADIDILVRPQDVLAAIDALQSIGITSLDAIPRNPRTWATTQLLGKDWILDDSTNGCHVELHWRVELNPFLLPTRFEQWFERRSSIKLGGTSINMLGIEDLFIQVMVHGARSLWTRLHWLQDFDALLRRDDIDWQRVKDLVATDGLQQILVYSWQLSNRLLTTPPPAPLEGLIGQASARQQRRAKKLVDKSLLSMRQRQHITWLSYRRCHLQLKQTAGFRLFELATMIGPNQPDVMQLPLPIYLLPVYVLLRPWFVIQRRLGEH
jgi:hypothetical protein